jgi:hypothetical protein
MTKKLLFKQNKAGKWINTKTGRFASKAEYQPYAERKAKTSIKKSEASKEYWKDVKELKTIYEKMYKLTGDNKYKILNTEDAREKLKKTTKYLAKKGKKPFQWSDFWKDVNKQKLDKKSKADYKQKLEDEDFELISF